MMLPKTMIPPTMDRPVRVSPTTSATSTGLRMGSTPATREAETGGAARMFDGLTVEAFRHRTSIVRYAEGDLRDALPVVRTFADIEGLDGHRASADIRFPGA